ncbi:MAG: hypothetical protein E6583_03855 [Clostridium sp.]|nr:hypothetical protein [Clostridium sp.]
MFEIGKGPWVSEISEESQEINAYKQIKPEGVISLNESKDFWDNIFNLEELQIKESNVKETDNVESDIEKMVDSYISDLHFKSEYSETISDRPIEPLHLEKLSPQEVAEKREEFDDKKAELKKGWENENGCQWPKYEQDVYSQNGKLIRKAGSDYDAHHIQPLSMGGKNEVSNITPLHAEVHYDRQGVHAPDSPYSKLDKILGGMTND